MLAALANVSVKPNPNALPGTSAIEKLIDGLAAFALLGLRRRSADRRRPVGARQQVGQLQPRLRRALEGALRAARRLRDRRCGGDHQLLLQLRLGGALMGIGLSEQRQVHVGVDGPRRALRPGARPVCRPRERGRDERRIGGGRGSARLARSRGRGRLRALARRRRGGGRLLPARLRDSGDPAARRLCGGGSGSWRRPTTRRRCSRRTRRARGGSAPGRSGSARAKGVQTLYASVPVGYRIESYSPQRRARPDLGLHPARQRRRRSSRRPTSGSPTPTRFWREGDWKIASVALAASGRRRRSRPAGARSAALT